MGTVKVKFSELQQFSDEQLAALSRSSLLLVAKTMQQITRQMAAYVSELEEKVMEVDGKYIRIRTITFAPSSEKSKNDKEKKGGNHGKRGPSSKLPSDRYREAEIVEKHVTFEVLPSCPCCNREMQDSGMSETSEYIDLVPKKYFIVRQIRHKYRCGSCHGSIQTAPPVPRVVPGSAFSDEVIVDATLSKYNDLLPMERYCKIAEQQGFPGLPPQTLIGLSLKLANFLKPVYELLKKEVLVSKVLMADETRHKMLEGSKKSNWFLWGFLGDTGGFFECHDTRSGDVASAILKNSNCEVLVSDAYTGYGKAVRETNELRIDEGGPIIEMALCNAHGRRQFVMKDDKLNVPDVKYMVEQYGKIYLLEREAKGLIDEGILEIRQKMRPHFDAMRLHAGDVVDGYPSKSVIYNAFQYFLKYFTGLTLFLSNPRIPIDNNPSERMLRCPVIGRKTWYGTHSPDGAEAMAIHFSLVNSCKINNVNPRIYYRELTSALHQKKQPFTPYTFKCRQDDS